MRRPIRYQLLVPLLILLFGVVGISTWTAVASANRARQRIAKDMQRLGNATYPLDKVLDKVEGLVRRGLRSR